MQRMDGGESEQQEQGCRIECRIQPCFLYGYKLSAQKIWLTIGLADSALALSKVLDFKRMVSIRMKSRTSCNDCAEANRLNKNGSK